MRSTSQLHLILITQKHFSIWQIFIYKRLTSSEAEINYNLALKISPNFTHASQNLGATLLKKMGRKADAANIYRSALEHSPNDTAVLLSLGGVYADMGELLQSTKCYEQIQKNNSDHANLLLDG